MSNSNTQYTVLATLPLTTHPQLWGGAAVYVHLQEDVNSISTFIEQKYTNSILMFLTRKRANSLLPPPLTLNGVLLNRVSSYFPPVFTARETRTNLLCSLNLLHGVTHSFVPNVIYSLPESVVSAFSLAEFKQSLCHFLL